MGRVAPEDALGSASWEKGFADRDQWDQATAERSGGLSHISSGSGHLAKLVCIRTRSMGPVKS